MPVVGSGPLLSLGGLLPGLLEDRESSGVLRSEIGGLDPLGWEIVENDAVEQRGRAAWPLAVLATLALWLAGAYSPGVSSTWVNLNLLTAAGRPHLARLPYAYPAVGVDGHTLASLLGVLLIVAALTRCLTYMKQIHHPSPGMTDAPNDGLQ